MLALIDHEVFFGSVQTESPTGGTNEKIPPTGRPAHGFGSNVSHCSKPESLSSSSGCLDAAGSFALDKLASGLLCSTWYLDHIGIIQPRLTGASPPPSGSGSFIQPVIHSDAARWSHSISPTTRAPLDGKRQFIAMQNNIQQHQHSSHNAC